METLRFVVQVEGRESTMWLVGRKKGQVWSWRRTVCKGQIGVAKTIWHTLLGFEATLTYIYETGLLGNHFPTLPIQAEWYKCSSCKKLMTVQDSKACIGGERFSSTLLFNARNWILYEILDVQTPANLLSRNLCVGTHFEPSSTNNEEGSLGYQAVVLFPPFNVVERKLIAGISKRLLADVNQCNRNEEESFWRDFCHTPSFLADT